jgi:hypothetical protein
MAATLEEIMVGVEDRLKTIDGLRTGVGAPHQITPPYAFVMVPEIASYRETFNRATYVLTVRVVVLTSASLDRAGQLKLASFANPRGESSIITAIEADKTLGGKAADTIVDSFAPLGAEDVAGIGYYGGEFVLRVAASGAA